MTVYTSALRLPVRQLPSGGIPLPKKPVRCAQIFPLDGAEIVWVRGILVDVRLSATVVPGAAHLFTEAIPGDLAGPEFVTRTAARKRVPTTHPATDTPRNPANAAAPRRT